MAYASKSIENSRKDQSACPLLPNAWLFTSHTPARVCFTLLLDENQKNKEGKRDLEQKGKVLILLSISVPPFFNSHTPVPPTCI